ncbi:Stk1 family PASTA domain-containing Ser/Thr kinase [Microbacterium imperiale]|uniref:non-specific serine/threonine protein kinase n=1 Tax=Microbacterium imperiale TaxID=33884 RepID=A0A9W6M283_9MICO|nr:Stk1 family PASTA domain-containing Ser/Thr kinase [Microbacterium imperiale]MBP2419933.1 serine/threonine-protein kinase [Microbacterium imperiale]MDS0198203.1 Stk1 family PASTA domain-containing Ser/Thr kinase [Microbacterium imperiale]BFE40273.1 Stk1 family PASTA domain-containing Ser/Thr kinase [Microbacterium imperiale]GLJ78750.1 serine/threonine protein kinase [Microbacterium imperiale]
MSMSQQTDPLIGRLVDQRYRVRARIARGGMATVYVATDLRLERRVALKVMHGHLSDDSVFQSRFIQEARSAARLADPHVVNVFDQGQDGEMAYLVMEYLPGITLRELLREQKRLTIPQTITIMDAILSGLAAAHRAGIVHRDVKPENVLLAEDGRIKIGDFGLARATTANTATGQMLLGTIAYLAPELVTRGTADARSDIYALGILLYEMLAGEQPYKGEQPMQIAYQHATDSVPRPSAKNPGVPEQLDELVLWATEREPDERPLDAKVMLDRLREIERELGVFPQVVRTAPAGAAEVVTDDDGSGSGEVTKLMPGTFTAPPVTTDVDNATRLRRQSRRNRTRGAWLVMLVIALAALAGGTGWWFGSGPGSLVAVPDVRGLTFDEAQGALAAQGLQATESGENSLDVQEGLTIRTDPDPGARLDRDAVVTIYVSRGPAEVSIPALAGQTEEAARELLRQNVVAVADQAEAEFDPDVAAGTVIRASVTPAAGGDPVDCTEGCLVRQGDAATLLVSRGAVPEVSGMSVERATRTLTDAGLEVAEDNRTEASTSIARGDVIGILGRDDDGNWRPGDVVTLIVSTGPPLFEVPDVVGQTRDAAAETLRGAGFEVSYSALWNIWPDGLTKVTAQDPAGGSMHVRGTTITLQITATG